MNEEEMMLIANVSKGIALFRALEILMEEIPPDSIEGAVVFAARARVIVKTARDVGSLNVVAEDAARMFAAAVKQGEEERVRRN